MLKCPGDLQVDARKIGSYGLQESILGEAQAEQSKMGMQTSQSLISFLFITLEQLQMGYHTTQQTLNYPTSSKTEPLANYRIAQVCSSTVEKISPVVSSSSPALATSVTGRFNFAAISWMCNPSLLCGSSRSKL